MFLSLSEPEHSGDPVLQGGGRDATSTANYARTSKDDGSQPVPASSLFARSTFCIRLGSQLEEPTATTSASELAGSPLTFHTTDKFSAPAYTRPHTTPPSAVSVTTTAAPATSPAELPVVTHVPPQSSLHLLCRSLATSLKNPDKGEPLYQDSFTAANRKLADLKDNDGGLDDELIDEPSMLPAYC